MTYSILICGVGGQGTLLASRLLGQLAVSAGYDVKVSEVHGMSQRGGSVITYVRYGEKVASPLIEKGGADMVLAFEKLEALRSLSYLKPEGTVVVNTEEIDPMPVITGAAVYPTDAADQIKSGCSRAMFLDAAAIAEAAGSSKVVNMALMGAMSRSMEFTQEAWESAIAATVPPKFLEVNLKAFRMAREAE